MEMEETPNQKQRQIRIDRAHTDELQKIELTTQDVRGIQIDTRILNKLQRKIQRRK